MYKIGHHASPRLRLRWFGSNGSRVSSEWCEWVTMVVGEVVQVEKAGFKWICDGNLEVLCMGVKIHGLSGGFSTLKLL